jgi:hypothetical protein
MAVAGNFEVIRDPLWNNIRVDQDALRVVDSAPFQRLRYIRQLGHAYLVYPGATHTRFEHALGTYHLARRALTLLGERGELEGIPDDDLTLVRLAALLHDIGHYPFSHTLEEAGLPSHELAGFGVASVEERIEQLIRGTSDTALQGLVSGSLDLDKIEYLTRDARMCGVPYGTVDADRLIHSLTVVTAPDGVRTIGVHEKGVSALESLLFAKYQMYRNVYWHHAVRSATVMFKRLVRSAIARGDLDAAWIPGTTDEALMEAVRAVQDRDLAVRLRGRQLYKRVLDLRGVEVPPACGEWIAGDPDLAERVENRMAIELGLEPGELLLDYPDKPAMLAVDLPLLLRDGSVTSLADDEATGLLTIERVADELHRSARRLRVFVARPVTLDRSAVLGLVERSADEVGEGLESGAALLGSSG